jgi:hypothetical protein
MQNAAADGEVVVIAPDLLAPDILAPDFLVPRNVVPEMAHSLFFSSRSSEVAGFHQVYLQECFHCRRPN